MVFPKLFCLLLFATSAFAAFPNKILSFSAQTDEPAPSRFLLMDDPVLKIYSAEIERAASPSANGPAISLNDVSQVIGNVITSNQVRVESESQEGNNLDYQLDLKNRKLNLQVNMQDNSLEIKLSSDGSRFDKEAVFTPDTAATNEIKTFLTDSFDSIKAEPPSRMLLDEKLQNSEALFNYLKAEADFISTYAVSYPLSDKNKLIVVKSKADNLDSTICYIEIDGSAPKYLKIRHNINEEPYTFMFQITHAIFIRKLNDDDTLQNVYDYIKSSITQIIEHIGKTSTKKATLEEVAAAIKQAFIGFTFKDYLLEGSDQKSLVLLANESANSPDKTAQVVVYPLANEFVGMDIVVYDRQYQAELPLFDFERQFAYILPRIKEILDSRNNLPFNTIEQTVDLINSTIKSICTENPIQITEAADKSFAFYSYAAKSESIGQGACIFADSKTGLVQYNFGYMHFIHMTFENALLKTEYMIAPNHKDHKQNIEEIIEELQLEIEAIKMARAANAEETTLKPESVESAILKSVNGKLKEEEGSSPGNYTFISADQKEEIKVKLSNGYYKLAFMKKTVDPDSPTSKFNVVKEIYIPEVNGYDQIARIEAQTNKFVGQEVKGTKI